MSFRTKFENFLVSFPYEPILAFAIGSSVGFIIVAIAQNAISTREAMKCEGSVIYKLIHVPGPMGGIQKCIPNREFIEQLKP